MDVLSYRYQTKQQNMWTRNEIKADKRNYYSCDIPLSIGLLGDIWKFMSSRSPSAMNASLPHLSVLFMHP